MLVLCICCCFCFVAEKERNGKRRFASATRSLRSTRRACFTYPPSRTILGREFFTRRLCFGSRSAQPLKRIARVKGHRSKQENRRRSHVNSSKRQLVEVVSPHAPKSREKVEKTSGHDSPRANRVPLIPLRSLSRARNSKRAHNGERVMWRIPPGIGDANASKKLNK